MEVAYNQSDFDYRRADGLNQSSLKKILVSPAHYQAALKQRFLPSPAMEMGTALHALILDGQEAFDASYVLKPEGISLATKEGKEWKAKLGRKKALAQGGKDDPWGSVQGMAESLRRLEWYSGTDAAYIKRNEVSFYWDWMGQLCKGRLDSVLVEEGIVLDLKTTISVEPDSFQKKVIGLGYDFQAAYYTKAAELAYGKPFRFIFAAVERVAPYAVELFEVSPDMMAEGMYKCEQALKIYGECSRTGEWPAPEPKLRSLEYPRWYNPVRVEETPSEDLF